METLPLLVKEVRAKIQEQITRREFVVKIVTSQIHIEELKNKGKKGSGKLKKVILNDFPYTDDSGRCWSWKIDLERHIPGLSTSNKTVDVALAIMRKKRLEVYLIELKSELDDHELTDILGKFQDSISRFYFLLLLNDSNDHKNFPNNLRIQFKGVVFYNGKGDAHQTEKIHQIFKNKTQSGKLECETLLGKDKIPVTFCSKNFDKTTGLIEISFNDIVNKLKQT
jgi:hypothetical protein